MNELINPFSLDIITNSEHINDTYISKISSQHDLSPLDIKDAWMYFRDTNPYIVSKFGRVPESYIVPKTKPTLHDVLETSFLKLLELGESCSLEFVFPDNKILYIVYLTKEWKEKTGYSNFMFIDTQVDLDMFIKILTLVDNEHTSSISKNGFIISYKKYKKDITD